MSQEDTGGPWLLLLGEQALGLASRLQLSGYRQLDVDDSAASAAGTPSPDAVILSSGLAGQIPELRQLWPQAALLLGVEDDSVASRSLCLASGANDFWLPAQGPSDLLSRLRLHLKAAERLQPPQQRLQLADLQLDPQQHRVKRGERLLALTAREYQLLLLLLEARGQVVSRETILQQIWSHDQKASNVIEVYVRYLRQKLEAGGERRLLHTVRGKGYCLRDGPPGRPLEPSGPAGDAGLA